MQRQAIKQDTFIDSEGVAAVDTALPALKALLVERFSQIAPACAHAEYGEFVQSTRFDRRLLKEVALQGGLPAGSQSEEVLHEWLVLLVDRKEIDLGGMVANAAVPAGVTRGQGSMRGSSCFISSVVQTLTGVAGAGDEHEQLCAQIRHAGRNNLWSTSNFIEASAETLGFIAGHVLGPGHSVVLNLYSSHDGSNVTHITCGEPAGRSQLKIHMFNPTGVHFDPLWPVD